MTAPAPPSMAAQIAHLSGVDAAAPRYEVEAADSYSLGETVDVIAFPGDHTRFEAPQLVSGRRLRGSDEAEVGSGLAQALGLDPGSTLALALSNGRELRLRVAGVVSSLDHDGRVAYVPATALLPADPSAPSRVAIRLVPGADQSRVVAALKALGVPPTVASSATSRGVPLVNTLKSILRAVAIVDGLVCLYALIQACALTVQERRRTIAVVRACGAGAGSVRRLLAGSVAAMIVPAAVVGIVLERFVFGPALSHLAINYAVLSLGASGVDVALTLAGLALASVVAVVWVARQAVREPVVAGLGE
jgi:ABC-type lipoprotein release transport system permease subunit